MTLPKLQDHIDIVVTPTHIERGTKGNAEHCAIALSIKEKFEDDAIYYAVVSDDGIEIELKDGGAFYFSVPESVLLFIKWFDASPEEREAIEETFADEFNFEKGISFQMECVGVDEPGENTWQPSEEAELPF